MRYSTADIFAIVSGAAFFGWVIDKIVGLFHQPNDFGYHWFVPDGPIMIDSRGWSGGDWDDDYRLIMQARQEFHDRAYAEIRKGW